jgi:hypothetical protein
VQTRPDEGSSALFVPNLYQRFSHPSMRIKGFGKDGLSLGSRTHPGQAAEAGDLLAQTTKTETIMNSIFLIKKPLMRPGPMMATTIFALMAERNRTRPAVCPDKKREVAANGKPASGAD